MRYLLIQLMIIKKLSLTAYYVNRVLKEDQIPFLNACLKC